MTYDDKVQQLTEAIRPYIKFVDVVHAESYWNSHRCRTPQDGEVNTEIEHLARQLLLHSSECPKVSAILADIGTGTTAGVVRCSALRDAIRQCARDFLSRREVRIDRELATSGVAAS